MTRDAPTVSESAAAARDALEAALLDLARLPAGVEQAPIAGAFAAAFASLDALARGAPGELAARLDGALARIREARAEIAVADMGAVAQALAARLDDIHRALGGARADVLAADSVTAWREQAAEPPRPALAVSRGVPALHHLDRGLLRPRVRLAAPRPPAASSIALLRLPRGPLSLEQALRLDEELAGQTEAAPDSAPDPLRIEAHGDDAAHLRRLLRNALEEIGALSLLLRPRGAERWTRGIPRFEQRILDDLDFVAALAEPFVPSGAEGTGGGQARRERLDVLAELLDYTDDAPVPDPARAFTRAFVLGCVAGEDTVRAAVLALRQSSADTHAAQRDALALASSPAVDPALERLAVGADPALARVALEALRGRRTVSLALAAPLVEHADPGVRAAAARGLAVVPERARAAALLAARLPRETDDHAWVAAVESLLLLGSRSGPAAARARISEALEAPSSLDPAAWDELLMLLAIAGAAPDADLLRRALRGRPGEAEALGWHGHPSLVEPLLAALTVGDVSFRAAAARSLHRITGLVPPAPGREPDPYEPEPDASAWRRLWEGQRGALAPDRRHRFGLPYAPAASLDELAREDVPGGVRERCAFELNVLAGGAAWIEVGDWCARKPRAIEALRSAVGDPRRPQAGLWLADRPGTREA